MRNIIVLFGPPGIGKGTIGSALSKKLKLPLISVGDLLREQIKMKTELAKKAESFMKQGELVPDSLVFEALTDRISWKDASGGFILDGFPRNLAQARMLETILKESDPCMVLNLEGTDSILIERLSKRRICEKCGAIYHLVNLPPKQEGICDKCAGKLIQRVDDRAEVIAKRLEVFRETTSPLLDHYKTKGCVYPVDAAGVLSETLEIIDNILDGKAAPSA